MNSLMQNLNIWQKTLLESVKKVDTPDLSERQMAILLTVYLKPYPHTVKSLSELLLISKPPVTRALDTLANYGFIKRQQDTKDKRKVLVMRTVKGAEFLNNLAKIINKSEGEYNL